MYTTSLIGSTALLIIILLLLRIERRYLNVSKFTPFFYFSIPTILVDLIINSLGKQLGFVNISPYVTIFTFIGLISFYLGGYFYLKATRYNDQYNSAKSQYTINHKLLFKCILFFVIIFEIIQIRGMFGSISFQYFEDGEFGKGGIDSHLGNLIIIFIIILIFNEKKNILSCNKFLTLILITISLYIKFATSVKGEVIIPIIGGVILLFAYKLIKFRISFLIFIGFIIAIIFMSMGMLFIGEEDFDPIYPLLYFLFYFSSGRTAFNQYIQLHPTLSSEDPSFLIMFFTNVKEKFFGTGNMVTPLTENVGGWHQVSTDDCAFTFSSNVFSLIGEVYINSGLIFGSIYLFILGGYCYWLYSIVKKDIFIGVAYSYACATLTLCFFSSYPLYFQFIYIQLLCFILSIINRLHYKLPLPQWNNH